MTLFRVLAADCPWKFGDRLPGKKRGAAKNYRVLTIGQIKAYPLPPLAKDCYLFLWRVSSMQEEALEVMHAWGFDRPTEFVWEKLTKEGKPWFGMGRTLRSSHEAGLVAKRGKPQPLAKNVRSSFTAPVPRDEEGKYVHSGKPEYFYTDVIEKLSAGPYVELFARRQRPGWTTWGDEAWGPPDEGGDE